MIEFLTKTSLKLRIASKALIQSVNQITTRAYVAISSKYRVKTAVVGKITTRVYIKGRLKTKAFLPSYSSLGVGLVTIIDQDNNSIAVVASPGTYQVYAFDGIIDTIDSNVVTFIDDIL